MELAIRDATRDDYDALCALNTASVEHTSPMDPARLQALDVLACYHRVACADGVVAAFLLAMCSGTAYVNDNFSWFAARYPRFVYVDRVVVAAPHRGLRLGTLLYEDLFRYARQNAVPLITCEYNIVPPNEPSRRFHDTFGFTERGTQWVADGTKRVSLQAADAVQPR
jgi:predicted GNAT superfamily acetyltransferase